MVLDVLKRYALRSVLVAIIVLAENGHVTWAGGGPRDVAIVINYKSSASREIGRYYQAARGIPEANICYLTCPDSELVNWDVCEKQIRQPLRRFLSRPELAGRIHYIVLTKGIPLAADYKDPSGVHSVASVLLNLDQDIGDLTGPTGVPDGKPDNMTYYAFPYGPLAQGTYGFLPPERAWRSDLFDSNSPGDPYDINKRFYLVTRLDAFTVDQVKSMIDSSVQSACEGVFALDRNNWLVGAYKTANNRLGTPLSSAYDFLTKRGFEVRFDDGTDFLSNLCGLLGYFSWASHDDKYTFNKYMSNFFVPGSIADTYYSYSGATFNDPGTTARSPLIADLFARGLCAAGGYVSEPYITAATYPNVLFDRYTRGFNVAESFYAACPCANWKTVVIGDPLMAPYATPPYVSLSLQDTVLSGVQTVAAFASDESGIAKVAFYFDDDLVAEVTEPPYEFELDTTQYAIGPHVLEAVAYDKSPAATQGSVRVGVVVNNAVSAVDRISEVLAYEDGQFVKVRETVVTAGTQDIGDGFYVEETDRSCALRVVFEGQDVSRGDLVTVAGSMATRSGDRIIEASAVTVHSRHAPLPGALMLRISSLGGAAVGSYTQPVGRGMGARNTALLVRIVGRVTESVAGEFRLTDFSTDEPVRVLCPGLPTQPLGRIVSATGICTVAVNGSRLVPVVRARDAGDVQVF